MVKSKLDVECWRWTEEKEGLLGAAPLEEGFSNTVLEELSLVLIWGAVLPKCTRKIPPYAPAPPTPLGYVFYIFITDLKCSFI